MNDKKYVGFDVHQSTTVTAVLNDQGKRVMESVLTTRAEIRPLAEETDRR